MLIIEKKEKNDFSSTSNFFHFSGDLRDCGGFVIKSLVLSLPWDVIFLSLEDYKSFISSHYRLTYLDFQFPLNHVWSPFTTLEIILLDGEDES